MGKTKKAIGSNNTPTTLGKKVLLVNRSGVPKFCAGTGRRLPERGMVVEYNGKFYKDFGSVSGSL